MDPFDDRLKALFARDEPPARDPEFTARVMEQVARRRLVADVLWLAAAAALGGAVLWALWPALQPAVMAVSQGLAPAAAVVALALGALVMLGARPREALGLEG